MSRIFISYRREDTAGYAGRLYDRLSHHFGENQIFMDIDTIEPGLDFVEVIEQAVSSCDVLIALIGKQWLTVADARGQRRLDNPEDFVRLEITTALDRKIRVIPALIPGATMPRSEELPEGLKKLARHNAIAISEYFHPEVTRLIQVVEKVLGSAPMPVPASMSPSVSPSKVLGSAPGSAPAKAEPIRPAKKKEDFEPELILIPAGEFLMGTDPQKDKIFVEAKKKYEDNKLVTVTLNSEQPQHRLYLPDYYITKTPVTNAQYAAFVRVTDYQTTAEEQGWGWVWMSKEFEKVAGAEWQHPTGPGSNISQKSNHPVVQISWDDAVAYCKWLAEETGKAYRLPTEAEWEKAARGLDGRIYPWGNEWDAKRCNTLEGGKYDTTSVGIYPTGASSYGVLDMAGNVWEWTESLWGVSDKKPDFSYPYVPTDGRENLEASSMIRRVLRGGSWYNYQEFARCAFRDWGLSFDRYNYRGCRVAMSPIL